MPLLTTCQFEIFIYFEKSLIKNDKILIIYVFLIF